MPLREITHVLPSVCCMALFNHFVSIVLVRMELEGGVNPLTRTQQQFTAVESSHLQATIVNNKINQVAWGGNNKYFVIWGHFFNFSNQSIHSDL